MLAFLPALLGSRIGQFAMIGIGAFVAGVFYTFSVIPQPDIQAIVRNAENGRDAHWSRKLALEAEAYEHKLNAAVAEREATVAPATDADVDELCSKSASCRDKSRNRK